MATYIRFLGRQLFICPSTLPKSLSLAGQTGIITGSNIGLGLAAASQLLSAHLSHLILAVRSSQKGHLARSQLLQSHPSAHIEVWELDLDSYESVLAFTDRCKALERIDFVLLNAGIVKAEFAVNERTGNEVTVQTNWLSTGLLALLLVPVLEASKAPSPQLSIVSSETGKWAALNESRSGNILKALNEPNGYDATERYYTSKLMVIYFFREMVQRVQMRMVVNTVNPGFCWGSGLHREVPGVGAYVLAGMKRIIGRSTAVGARTLTNAAVVQGRESHGRYLEDKKIKAFWPMFDTQDSKRVQKRLWDEMVEELSPVADLSRYNKSS